MGHFLKPGTNDIGKRKGGLPKQPRRHGDCLPAGRKRARKLDVVGDPHRQERVPSVAKFVELCRLDGRTRADQLVSEEEQSTTVAAHFLLPASHALKVIPRRPIFPVLFVAIARREPTPFNVDQQ